MVIRKRLDAVISGLAYLTTTVKNWLPVFTHDGASEFTLRQLAETVSYHETSVVAYCLMPSHLHAILHLNDIRILSDLMGSFKSLSSKRLKKEFPGLFGDEALWGKPFHLWKPRFDDFIIRDLEQFRIKMNYIHENPVRAGLVGNATDWRYSSASDWLLDRKGIIEIDKSVAAS
jgi:putative transposase